MKFKKLLETKNIIVIFIYLIIGITFMFVQYSMLKYNLYQKISNDYIEEDSICFSINSKKQISIKDLEIALSKNQILYKEEEMNIKKIYLEKGNFSIPIIKGRTFNNNDFNGTKNLALVGENIDTFKNHNGKEYYIYNEKYYEIIGIIGTDKPSKLDYKIYLNYNIEETDLNGIWILEGNKLKNTFNQIKFSLQENDIIYKIVNKELLGLNRIFQINNNIKIIRIIFLIIIFSIIIILSYYWILQKRKEIAILKICGIGINKILLHIIIEYVSYSFPSYIIGTIITILCINDSNQIIKSDNIIKLFFNLIIGIIILSIPTIIYSKNCIINILNKEM